MAYAGSPLDLANQPAPSTSSERGGSWKPLVTAIGIAAIVVVTAMTSAQIAGLQQSVAPAGLSRAQIAGLQQSVSQIVDQTASRVRLPRTHR